MAATASPGRCWTAWPNNGAAVRLACLAYAGGCATAYRNWSALLPPSIELYAAELPGRGRRLAEPPLRDLRAIVADLADGLPASPMPFALFGHSLGALLAFELARESIRRGGAPPIALFAAACPAPHLPRRAPTYDLPDAEFARTLARLGGTPPEVLADPELTSLLMPALRADLELFDRYEYAASLPLPCPIIVLGGASDRHVGSSDLDSWQPHGCGFARHMFAGDHFFPRTAEADVVRIVAAQLLETVRLHAAATSRVPGSVPCRL